MSLVKSIEEIEEEDRVRGHHGAFVVVASVPMTLHFSLNLVAENARVLLFEGVLHIIPFYLSLSSKTSFISNHWEQKEELREETY